MGGLEMFKEMRNSKRLLPDEYVSRVLNEGEYGILATYGENGYPYAVPVSYVYINDAIYFHCATEGQKLDNIKYNSKVSFCVVGNTKLLPSQFSTAYQSVIVFGKASDVSDDEKRQVLVALIDKYSKGFEKEGMEYINRAFEKTHVVKITVDHATAKGRLEV